MQPVPLYSPVPDKIAFQLRFAWTAWPSTPFEQTPSELIETTKPLWEADGLRVLEHRWTAEQVQILFSCKPDVSPVFMATRAKGRLDHALRQAAINVAFNRKVSLRSIGDNTRRDVESYIERQVRKERFVDPRFAETMAEFTCEYPEVDLSQPAESARGRYWYNLHVVLIVESRGRISDTAVLRLFRDQSSRIAARKGHAISRIAVMPDHLHLALRGTIEESPSDIALAYQNNLAFALGQKRIWSDGFYVGTFSEYTTQAVRNIVSRSELDEKR